MIGGNIKKDAKDFLSVNIENHIKVRALKKNKKMFFQIKIDKNAIMPLLKYFRYIILV
jgi:hypothetical protein